MSGIIFNGGNFGNASDGDKQEKTTLQKGKDTHTKSMSFGHGNVLS
ncbi:hypothetical protein [Neobacillus endophyticus]|nr:hypothetical protein [Neobacillus endophyticus]